MEIKLHSIEIDGVFAYLWSVAAIVCYFYLFGFSGLVFIAYLAIITLTTFIIQQTLRYATRGSMRR